MNGYPLARIIRTIFPRTKCSIIRQFSVSKHLQQEFAKCDACDVRFFETIVGANNVKISDLDAFNIDFMRQYKGIIYAVLERDAADLCHSKCVVLPSSESEVAELLRHCYNRRLAVVPQAGNTGLAGGSVPYADEIIISTRRLVDYFRLDPFSHVLHCDSGFILDELDNRLAEWDLAMPLDLASRGSCLIGGNLATNAGGVRQIRYGSLHANVLGLRVAIPDGEGTVLQLGCGLPKDNSDIQLKNVFIGSEGQFGIITHATILVTDRLRHVRSMFLAIDSYDRCCEVLRTARRCLGRALSAFEFMDAETVECVVQNSAVPNLLPTDAPFYLLIETAGIDSNDDAKVDVFFARCFDQSMVLDGVLASNAEEAASFWRLRDEASVTLLQDGHVYKFDLSLPLDRFYAIVEIVRKRLAEHAPQLVRRCVGFGHLGDGNVHLNVVAERDDSTVRDLLYPFVYKWVVENGGSISAEHGIGQMRRDFHHHTVPRARLQINEDLKRVFDPRGILSPFKMI